ncbi:hypothetical protein PYW07_016207 [Mythimna separata]|uniref:Uncharacterized protein n=1 Tax=Mythimna separata TaxID=271217 RepID=A0AAD7YTC4_MYTSE|nr:hypothetical protein PYW07_016207 [Mythimna separata]
MNSKMFQFKMHLAAQLGKIVHMTNRTATSVGRLNITNTTLKHIQDTPQVRWEWTDPNIYPRYRQHESFILPQQRQQLPRKARPYTPDRKHPHKFFRSYP